MSTPKNPDRFTVAILALGGQGGGVLADWIIRLAEANGYITQGTSVPGVAQRTGSTIYYIEMVRRAEAGANRPPPVLALMPVPGDVDVVIASELMEAGRAMVRGLVTQDRTTLVSSTHRIYAISEKSVRGDGRVSSEKILEAATRRAERFIGFDMEAASTSSGSAISAVMFGALAGANVLPFAKSTYDDAIRAGGIAVSANLRGLEAGISAVEKHAAAQPPEDSALERPTTHAGRALWRRIEDGLPVAAQPFAVEGVRRLMDYQDRRYADLYLDRLLRVRAQDDGRSDWLLTREVARYLALWMSYEDTIRVADFKIRAARRERVARDVVLNPSQLIHVTDYMHPRLQEVAETLPSWAGRPLMDWPVLRNALEPMFKKGRHVRTTSFTWYLSLRALASMRRIRRATLRYREEQRRIETWLEAIASASDVETATELALSARLIKGYSDTFERGLAQFKAIMAVSSTATADHLRTMREQALATSA